MRRSINCLYFCGLAVAAVLGGGCKKTAEPNVSITPNHLSNITLASGADDFDVINWGSAKSQLTLTHEINGDVVNGKLYIFGGHDFSKRPQYWTQTPKSYVYDPITNTWSSIADLPYLPNSSGFGGVSNAGVTNDGTSVYLAGGYICNATGTGQVFATKQVWKYNIATNSYEQLPDLPRALGAAQLKFLNGKLHFMGGADLSRNDVNSHFVLDLNNLSAGWKTAASLPSAINQSGSAVLNGKIYVVGGARGNNSSIVAQKTLQVYDEVTNKWTLLAPMTTARSHIASTVITVGNRILVLGGETSYGVTSKLVSAYSPANNTWAELSPLPSSRSGGVAGYINGQIYYTGGNFLTNNYKGGPIITTGTTTVLNPSDDAFTRDGTYNNTNYGADSILIIKGSKSSGYSRASYIKFSIAGITNASNAKLRLFGFNADNTTSVTLSCYALTNNDWAENVLTFANAPTAQTTTFAVANVNNERKYIEFDVTELVKNQLISNNTSISLTIKDAANKNATINLNSKEASDNKPQLVIISN
ncbi:MAG: DNRLRE domain-containing protein [Mucilaginibacter sp.]|nr:DNRLRE domain-containing protein [Mucilaginibacter sp.]